MVSVLDYELCISDIPLGIPIYRQYGIHIPFYTPEDIPDSTIMLHTILVYYFLSVPYQFHINYL